MTYFDINDVRIDYISYWTNEEMALGQIKILEIERNGIQWPSV